MLPACADGLRHEFPPLRSATSPLRDFPTARTRIIGRKRLLAEIAERLDCASLVTLTGVRGAGKTRVAIEAGRRLGLQLPDGAAFVDLSPPHVDAGGTQKHPSNNNAPESLTA